MEKNAIISVSIFELAILSLLGHGYSNTFIAAASFILFLLFPVLIFFKSKIRKIRDKENIDKETPDSAKIYLDSNPSDAYSDAEKNPDSNPSETYSDAGKHPDLDSSEPYPNAKTNPDLNTIGSNPDIERPLSSEMNSSMKRIFLTKALFLHDDTERNSSGNRRNRAKKSPHLDKNRKHSHLSSSIEREKQKNITIKTPKTPKPVLTPEKQNDDTNPIQIQVKPKQNPKIPLKTTPTPENQNDDINTIQIQIKPKSKPKTALKTTPTPEKQNDDINTIQIQVKPKSKPKVPLKTTPIPESQNDDTNPTQIQVKPKSKPKIPLKTTPTPEKQNDDINTIQIQVKPKSKPKIPLKTTPTPENQNDDINTIQIQVKPKPKPKIPLKTTPTPEKQNDDINPIQIQVKPKSKPKIPLKTTPTPENQNDDINTIQIQVKPKIPLKTTPTPEKQNDDTNPTQIPVKSIHIPIPKTKPIPEDHKDDTKPDKTINMLEYSKMEKEFLKCEEQFLSKYPNLAPLPPTEVSFKFPSEYKPSTCTIPINTETATIEEIKTIVSDHLSPSKSSTIGPKSITLKYNGKTFDQDDQLFKYIKYKPGKFIEVSVQKKFYFIQTDKKTFKKVELIDDNMTVSDLAAEIDLKNGFQLVYNGDFLRDDQKVNDLKLDENEVIEIAKKPDKDTSKKSVTFILYEKVGKPHKNVLNYSEKKKLINYKTELGIINTDYVFMTCEGKYIHNDDDTLQFKNFNGKPFVNVYKKNSDDFDRSAKCVLLYEKPKMKAGPIIVRSIDAADSEDPSDGEITINEGQKITTIGDLRVIVAHELGFKKKSDIDLVSLLILYTDKGVTNYALLNDDEEMAKILNENPGKFISYLIHEEVGEVRPKFLKKYSQIAMEKYGLSISDDEIKDIYFRANKKMDYICSTFAYMAYKD